MSDMLLYPETVISFFLYLFQLFRSLQGQKDDTIHHYLHKAKGTNGIKLARVVMETKQEETMKTVFMKEIGVSEWEEAKLKFPLAAKRLLKLTGIQLKSCIWFEVSLDELTFGVDEGLSIFL